MENIGALLKEQAELAKKIADAYGAQNNQKQFFQQLKDRKQAKANARGRFAQAMADLTTGKAEKPLINAGWIKGSTDATTGDSTWTKKGTTKKIVMNPSSTFKVLDGSTVVAGPLEAANIAEWLKKYDTPTSVTNTTK